KSATVLLASAVPVKTGVVLLVTLSLLELPVSLAAVMAGLVGGLGAVVSIVMLRAAEVVLVLRAASVALTVMLWVPLVSVPVMVMVQLPVPLAVAPYTTLFRSKSATVLLASAVPAKAGVVLLVTLSLLELPVSLAFVRSGVVGAAGAV